MTAHVPAVDAGTSRRRVVRYVDGASAAGDAAGGVA